MVKRCENRSRSKLWSLKEMVLLKLKHEVEPVGLDPLEIFWWTVLTRECLKKKILHIWNATAVQGLLNSAHYHWHCFKFLSKKLTDWASFTSAVAFEALGPGPGPRIRIVRRKHGSSSWTRTNVSAKIRIACFFRWRFWFPIRALAKQKRIPRWLSWCISHCLCSETFLLWAMNKSLGRRTSHESRRWARGILLCRICFLHRQPANRKPADSTPKKKTWTILIF